MSVDNTKDIELSDEALESVAGGANNNLTQLQSTTAVGGKFGPATAVGLQQGTINNTEITRNLKNINFGH